MRGFFEKKPLKLPKKLSNIIFVPCVPYLFYGRHCPAHWAPTPNARAFCFWQHGDSLVESFRPPFSKGGAVEGAERSSRSAERETPHYS